MSDSADSALDALWDDLAPHVEWPEEFSLVVLFAGHPGPVGELRERLEASVRQRGKTLGRIEPAREDDVRALVPEILAASEPDCGARWISFLQGAGDDAWTAALRWLLQRLNERRFVLERDVRVPVVFVLPLEMRAEFYALAPDLWSVRGFAEVVPSPTIEEAVIGSEPSMVPGRDAQAPAQEQVRPPERVEAEWTRLIATGDLRRLSIWDGVAAHEAALARGDLTAARRIAMETLAVVLSQVGVMVETLYDFDVTKALAEADVHSTPARRELFASLVKLGEVEVREGNLAAARSLFQRCLAIAEALAEADPRSTLAQRMVSLSLIMLGDVEEQAGNLAVARSLFQRCLSIAEALAEADPLSAQAQRELCVSLSRLGGVEVQAGNLGAARDLFRRSLKVREHLAVADPHSAQAQHDLFESLVSCGDVEVRDGNLAAARSLFQRSLSIAEVLADADPHSAQAQRDLSLSLITLGSVEARAGNLAAARSFFQRSLAIAEALAEADPHDAQVSFDVVKSLELLAWAAAKDGDHASETDHLRRARAILAAMDARGQVRDYAERARLLEDITRRLS